MTSPHLSELTLDQCSIAARACDVHRQMLSRQVRTMPDGWKKDGALNEIEDLQTASDVLKRREQELLSE